MQLPEEKLALRWLQRLGLRPPIDAATVLMSFARLIEDEIPFDADAVLIRKVGTQPTVIIQQGMTATRRNFTVAHELGHLLIPWHSGSFVCKTDPFDGPTGLSEFIHRELEKEANRFAAEFLLPTHYVEELFNRFGAPQKMLEETSRATVSKLAASFKFLKSLPPGFLMIEVDHYNRVVRAGRTNHTAHPTPEVGSDWEKRPFEEMRAHISSTGTSDGEIIWVDLRNARLDRPPTKLELSATEVANAIFDELGVGTERKSLLASINGVIGAANGTNRFKKSGDLYTILCVRFKGRERLEQVVAHRRFKEFLATRVQEIEGRDVKSQS